MLLATWNVALPVAPGRRQALRSYINNVGADVWVLTETHDDFTTGQIFSMSSAPGRDGRHAAGHHWVTIWSTYRLEPLATSDKKRAAAARVITNDGQPFIVYGTVLPWTGSDWEGHPAAGGVAYREALRVQTADWKRLRGEYPDDEFFVLGDFNQDFVSPRYYGSRANRALLEEALAGVGVAPLTAGDRDPVRRDSAPCASIDHICARTDSLWRAGAARRWPDSPKPPRGLSDHFGVAVPFSRG